MTNQLIVLPTEKKELEAVFLKAENLEPLIEKIREQAASLPTDMSVKKNREAVASFAYKIARTKTTVEKSGAQLSAEYKELPKKIDASRKFYRETFEAVHSEVRGPLNDWELAEKMRVSELEDRLEMLTRAATPPDETPLAELEQRLGDLEKLVVDESWQEIEAEAHRARNAAITALSGRIMRRAEIEKKQAEIDRLTNEAAAAAQAAREKQIAQDAAEAATLAAAAQVEQSRLQAAQAEQAQAQAEEKAKQAAAQSEQDALSRAEQARLGEVARQQAEQQAAQDAKDARAANIEHRATINRGAAAALGEHASMTPEQARRVVIAIVQGLVPGVAINY